MKDKIFTAEQDGYKATIILGAALGCPFWEIMKDGVRVDTCFQHSPTKCELTAKVQVERIINNLLTYKTNNNES